MSVSMIPIQTQRDRSPSPSGFPALLLNNDCQPLSWLPLSTLTWQEAVKSVVKGDVDVLAEYDRPVRSPSVEMRLPSVVMLRQYVPICHSVSFTRRNIFLRDRYCCQYCGRRFPESELTFEHIVPRSRGGRNSWENVCSACMSCNGAKGDHMPDPSGGLPLRMVDGRRLRLIRWPQRPSAWELYLAGRELRPAVMEESWRELLYYDAELDEGSTEGWGSLVGA